MSQYTLGNFQIHKDQLVNTEAVPDLVDPKIYSGNTYKDAFVYDSSEYDIPIGEMLCTVQDHRTKPEIDIDYYQSNAISSDLGFKFTVKNGANVKYQETFGDIMLSNRNNELPLFTSEYLDYMKNGYNYDKEKMERQAAQSTANMITSAASAAATAAIAGAIKGSTAGWVGAAVGGAIGLVAGGVAAINSNKQAESDIEQKINEKANKAYNVSQVNDRSLFNWYSDNKLHRMRFEPDEKTKELIKDYYKLYGYSKGIYCKPNTDNRYFYNYVRGDVDLDGLEYQPFFKYKEAIAEKYKEGVYYIHNRAATRGYWDINLECNNYDTALLPNDWIEKEYNE